ncbi:Hypothetical predicted protein [Octopus vulgaris]|uniref:Uncharacterized protein n=1 Tax=Octopus vulgaris TaxID=6645 RepID=A0AA36B5M1_OCTVU|nr:Hypothetical predicted protein [Octopus vulgaris]
MHEARKTIIHRLGIFWTRTDTPDCFDIPMGAQDSAEVTDLVRIYLLHLLHKVLPEFERSLYKDDVLFVVQNAFNRKIKIYQKKLHKVFKSQGLTITIEPDHTSVKALDAHFKLTTSAYQPDHKPNSNITYIHAQSNNASKILDNIRYNIENRINSLSSNEEFFNKHAYYNLALRNADYEYQIKYKFNNDFSNHNTPQFLNTIMTWNVLACNNSMKYICNDNSTIKKENNYNKYGPNNKTFTNLISTNT